MAATGGRRCGVVVAGAVLVALVSGGAPAMPFEVMSDWLYYNRTGWLALDAGRLDRAEQAFRMAIARLKPYETSDRVILARSYADLARVLHRKGRDGEAEPLARWALAVREGAPGKGSDALCRDLESLAEIDTARGRDDEAEPLLKRALALREAALGAGHAGLIPAAEALAGVYDRRGKAREAESLYRRAVALRAANHAESVRRAEEDEKKAAVIRIVIEAGSASQAGSQVLLNLATQAHRLETHALSLREASAESVSAALTAERYSAVLRRTGRTAEADDQLARAKTIRDAVESRAARSRAAAR